MLERRLLTIGLLSAAEVHAAEGFVAIKTFVTWGAWVARWVKHLALDLGSGHDLKVCEIKPCIGLCVCQRGACLGFSLSLLPSLPLSLSLSLS